MPKTEELKKRKEGLDDEWKVVREKVHLNMISRFCSHRQRKAKPTKVQIYELKTNLRKTGEFTEIFL